MIATIARKVAGKFMFGLTPASGALGRAGDSGEQDRAKRKAHDADLVKVGAGEARASLVVARTPVH